MISKYTLMKQSFERYNQLSLEYRMSIKQYFQQKNINCTYITVNPVQDILKIGFIPLSSSLINDFEETFDYILESVELEEDKNGKSKWITIFKKKEGGNVNYV